MVELGPVTETCLFAKDRQSSVSLNPSRNPTGEANLFAHSFQAPSSQLSDHKYPHRRFCVPPVLSQAVSGGVLLPSL